MGTRYEQLTLAERIELYRLYKQGEPMRAIAKALGRSVSTVSREFARNSRPTKAWPGGYEPARANDLAQRRRRWDNRFKLTKKPQLQTHVREQLLRGWSPEEISGRLALEHGRCIVSHESIYRFLYHRSAQKDYWHRLLPRHKSRRGRLGQRGGSSILRIKHRVPIAERCPEISTRLDPGHWEADLMLFARYGQAVLVTHERRSRVLIASRQPNKAALPVVGRLLRQSQCCRPLFGKRSPSITALNSRSTTGLTNSSAWRPIFAIRMRLGRKAASRMRSDACAARCRARPTWPRCRRPNSMSW